jgi:hypothetical protein
LYSNKVYNHILLIILKIIFTPKEDLFFPQGS